MVPYKIVKADNGDAWVEVRGEKYAPAQISRLRPAEDEGDRRGLSRRAGRRRPSSPSRPTSTTASARRPRTPAGSPASTCCASSTSRPRPRSPMAWTRRRPDDRGLRPRRRHLRHLDPRDRRRRVRGEVDQRRHVPRRRGLRQAHHRLAGRRVQEGARHRSAQRPAGAAAPEGGRREGEDRAVVDDADGDQPAVHHGGRQRARSI